MNSTLEITRSDLHMNKLRKCSIIIDGKKIARIGNSQTILVPIYPGSHSIHARIDCFNTNKIQFEILAGQTLKFLINNRRIPLWKHWAIIILFCLCLAIGATFGALGAAIGVGIGGVIYSLTVGKMYIQEQH